VPNVARPVVGRESELSAIIGRLTAPDRRPGVAVLVGEAGIGKTTLWLASLDDLTNQGFRMLSARPAEAETHFAFAGLTDLFAGVVDVVAELPFVQRSALEAVFLLREPAGRVDDRVVAAAFLAALRRLAADGPVCVAVDDIQWLDAPSLATLRYALARLDNEPVMALMAVRTEVPEWLRRAVPEERLHTLTVTGLTLDATKDLLRARLDASFPRPTLVRLWTTSGGNPLFALELASALQRRGGTLDHSEGLPIPSNLDDLLRARIDQLGAAALGVAHAVAVLAEPNVTVLEAALDDVDHGLTEAIGAKILELDGEQARFAHPLLASAILARHTPISRRRLHARLAQVVTSADERARHLALATTVPTDEVAATLEHAAMRVYLGGAPAAAADLAQQALRLTPDSSRGDAMRRTIMAANMHARSGDNDRAAGLLERTLASAAPGDERATVLSQLAEVHTEAASLSLYHQALAEAQDAALRATIHSGLAIAMRWRAGVDLVLEQARQAAHAAADVTDDAVRCRALAVYATAHFYAGHGIATQIMEEAISLERRSADAPLREGPTVQFGWQLLWSADIERGREVLGGLERSATMRDKPAAKAEALWQLGFLEWRAGDWDRAEQHVAESLALLTQLGALTPVDECPGAVIAAHRGRVDQARRISRSAITRAESEGIRIAESGHGWVLGFIELSLGNAEAALIHLRRSYEIRDTLMREPAQRVELGDLLEALTAVGDLDEVERVLNIWQERATALDRAWALAILGRCRAVLLAARGDLDGAFASFDGALVDHARSTDPFNNGRTLLALGRTQRRAKRRNAARSTLNQALATFDHLGAPLWSDQARAELARVGGRASSAGDLTEAERRIAALVADGHTNREVAAALFLTEHTVETTLTRVYRKLGVRSRAALIRLLAANT
jgi:DNA-binding CsgD family transcriptional regulator